ncbi:MAG: ribonuclease Z [Lachnospiraceae bacterium]|nr:ribonuclease Z [Lachnospiraceae bacterium]
MLDVCLLGTSGMMPLPKRWLTSLLTRYNGSSLLIDCGEGTQIALREAGFSSNPIDIILITHFHADHISGLPGLLLSMGNADRTEELLIVGPKGLARVVNSLRVICPELPFRVSYKELHETDEFFEKNGYNIHAYKVKHNVPCYGYSIEIKRAGRFNAEAAKEKEIPLKCWNPLQKGETVTLDGKTYTPDMVMGPERKGLKVTYCTDSRPTEEIVAAAKDSDLFVCEGMYSNPEDEKKAREKKHMTFFEAAEMAKKANVKELWLTHFSPSMFGPDFNVEGTRKIFKETYLGKDGKFVELNFEEEEEQV